MSKRIEKWDILKFFLIFLVVLGHVCDFHIDDSKNIKAIFFWIYSFHMPLFLFVSGLFSKGSIDNKRFDKLSSYLVLLFFTQILDMICGAVFFKNYNYNFLILGGLPWFMFALFLCPIITMAIKKLPFLPTLIGLIVIGCLMGFYCKMTDF